MDGSLSDTSSEEDMTPLMRFGKGNLITKIHDMVDSTPKKGLIIRRQPEDLKLMSSNVSIGDREKIVDDASKIPASYAESKCRFALNKLYSSDNSDEEESPLAALASRHLRNKVVTSGNCGNSSFSVLGDEIAKNTEINNCNEAYETDSCEADNNEGQQMCGEMSQHGSMNRKKVIFGKDSSCINKDNVNEDDRNSDDSVYSPLVRLADKYLKVEDVEGNTFDHKLGKCESSSDSAELLHDGVTQGESDEKVYCPLGTSSNVPKCLSNPPGIGVFSTAGNILRPFVCQNNKIQEEENDFRVIRQECTSAPKEVQRSEDFREDLLKSDILANEEEASMHDHKQASSLSDLAFHHLSKSASSNTQFDNQFAPKKFLSDTGISKSVPSGFVIPFLSKSENNSFSSASRMSGENAMEMSEGAIESDVENVMEMSEGAVESDVSAGSCEDWVIDLTGALRDPELRFPLKSSDTKFSTTVIHIDNTELQEESVKAIPCHLDASEILKMKFSYSKKRCSPFGRVVCRAWRHLSGPYISHSKQIVGTVTHFSFDEPSPDDAIFIHRGEKK